MFKYFQKLSLIIFTILISYSSVYADQFDRDLSLDINNVIISDNIIIGNNVRIYVTINNNSNYDLSGVVKFFDEEAGMYISTDQPVSVIAKKTDDVFIDWKAEIVGKHSIAMRIIPWDTTSDNPDNNKIAKEIYVDRDTDGDGIGDRRDPDDDNDNVPDSQDYFPLNPNESIDSDRDKIGDNTDTDDDNDNVSDIEDVFPLDPKEWADKDSDGVGDNADAFPDNPNEWQDSDGDGLGDNSDSDNQNHGPIPQIQAPQTKIRVDKIVTFNALKAHDPDGQIVTYEWNFGDGTIKNGVIADHTFKKTGSYPVTLTITDDRGESRKQAINIIVSYKTQDLFFVIFLLMIIFLIIISLIRGVSKMLDDDNTKPGIKKTTTLKKIKKRIVKKNLLKKKK